MTSVRDVRAVSSTLETIGTGTITVTAARSVYAEDEASFEAVDGDITLTANRGAEQTAGDYRGIDLQIESVIRTTGSGNITLSARGGTNLDLQEDSDGIHIEDSTIEAAGTGSVTLTGDATHGFSSDGIDIETGSTIRRCQTKASILFEKVSALTPDSKQGLFPLFRFEKRYVRF